MDFNYFNNADFSAMENNVAANVERMENKIDAAKCKFIQAVFFMLIVPAGISVILIFAVVASLFCGAMTLAESAPIVALCGLHLAALSFFVAWTRRL